MTKGFYRGMRYSFNFQKKKHVVKDATLVFNGVVAVRGARAIYLLTFTRYFAIHLFAIVMYLFTFSTVEYIKLIE